MTLIRKMRERSFRIHNRNMGSEWDAETANLLERGADRLKKWQDWTCVFLLGSVMIGSIGTVGFLLLTK